MADIIGNIAAAAGYDVDGVKLKTTAPNVEDLSSHIAASKVPPFFSHKENLEAAEKAAKDGAEKPLESVSVDLAKNFKQVRGDPKPSYKITRDGNNENIFHVTHEANGSHENDLTTRFNVDFSRAAKGSPPEIIEERLNAENKWVSVGNFGLRAERLEVVSQSYETAFTEKGITFNKEPLQVASVEPTLVPVEETNKAPVDFFSQKENLELAVANSVEAKGLEGKEGATLKIEKGKDEENVYYVTAQEGVDITLAPQRLKVDFSKGDKPTITAEALNGNVYEKSANPIPEEDLNRIADNFVAAFAEKGLKTYTPPVPPLEIPIVETKDNTTTKPPEQQTTSGKSFTQAMTEAFFDKSQKPVESAKVPDFFKHVENFNAAIAAADDTKKGKVKAGIDLSSWRSSHGEDKPEYVISKGKEEGVYHMRGQDKSGATRFTVDFTKKDKDGVPEITEERLTSVANSKEDAKWIANTADGNAVNMGYRSERLGLLATSFEAAFGEKEIEVKKTPQPPEKTTEKDVVAENVIPKVETKEPPKTLKTSIADLDSLLKSLEENIANTAEGKKVIPIEVGKKKEPAAENKDQADNSVNSTPVIVEVPAHKEEKKNKSMFSTVMRLFGGGKKEEEVVEEKEDETVSKLQGKMNEWAEKANKITNPKEMEGLVQEIAKERTSAALKQLGSEGKIKDGEEKDGVKPQNIEFESPETAEQFCKNYQKACEGLGIDCKMTQKEGGGFKLTTPKECAGKDIFNMSPEELEELKTLIETNKEAAKVAAAEKAAIEAKKTGVEMDHGDEEEEVEEPHPSNTKPPVTQQQQDDQEDEEEIDRAEELEESRRAQELAKRIVGNGSVDFKAGHDDVDANSLANIKGTGMSREEDV